MTNSSSDAHPIGVTSQAASSGQVPVAPGTYTNVTGQGTGPWSVSITPTG
jgi:hypothetical protein